jgi:hypothetical protein
MNINIAVNEGISIISCNFCSSLFTDYKSMLSGNMVKTRNFEISHFIRDDNQLVI